MNSTISLNVGEIHHLATGRDRIVYAGMPAEGVYSIVEIKWEAFYRGYAWNLYFPMDASRIRIDGVDLVVESVDERQITLRA